VLDAPIYENLFRGRAGQHLKAVSQALDVKTKHVSLTVGVKRLDLRQTELPQIPVEDMRLILKNNTKNYLQQDLPITR